MPSFLSHGTGSMNVVPLWICRNSRYRPRHPGSSPRIPTTVVSAPIAIPVASYCRSGAILYMCLTLGMEQPPNSHPCFSKAAHTNLHDPNPMSFLDELNVSMAELG